MKEKFNNLTKTKTAYIILIILSLLLIIGVGTYSLVLWTSGGSGSEKNTRLGFKIGDIAEILFDGPSSTDKDVKINLVGDNEAQIEISNLGPVFDYNDGKSIMFSINNLSTNKIITNVKFNIDPYNTNAVDESFKYKLLSTTDGDTYEVVSEGSILNEIYNFDGMAETLDLNLVNNHELLEKITYKFIFYIDGNMKNPIGMQNISLTGSIFIDATKIDSLYTLNELGLTVSDSSATDGIFSAEDDLGTSYYFKGNVTNNYVKFGKYTEDAYARFDETTGYSSYSNEACGSNDSNCTQIASVNNDMYWRIVRINGNGTVRMIYEGTHQPFMPEHEEELTSSIGLSLFNNSKSNAYVGYMYGDINSITYNDTHKNNNDSLVKISLDNWYFNYLYEEFDQYIADAIYCNDRSLHLGTGTGAESTTYSAVYRFNNFAPILTCNQGDDAFTSENSTLKLSNGQNTNKKLKYKVGLITMDEIMYAGVTNDNVYEYSTYLLNGTSWSGFTMTPFSLDEKGECNIFSLSRFAFMQTLCDYQDQFRPVISLNYDALKYGTGVSGDEFRIEA